MLCKNCQSGVAQDAVKCPVCNYPIQGTEQEQATFISRQVIQKSDVKESVGRVKKSRLILFILGTFYLIVPFLPIFGTGSLISLVFSMVLGMFFIGFGLLAFKWPKIALLIPLSITVLYYLLLLFTNPFLLWQGIIWKTIVVVGLGYGYFAILKADKILKKNPYLASTMGFGKIIDLKKGNEDILLP